MTMGLRVEGRASVIFSSFTEVAHPYLLTITYFSFWMKDKRIKEPLHLHIKDLQEN